MFKIILFLLIIYTTIIHGQNGLYSLINTFRVINYDVIPKNNFLVSQRNGLLAWKKRVERGNNGVKVYVESLSVQQLLPAGDLCAPTFFFAYVRQLIAVLSDRRSCPIPQGKAISIFQPFTERVYHPPLICLGTEFINFTLYDQKQKTKILSLEVELSSRGEACRNNVG